MKTTFEWDEDKSKLNVRKHGSSFEEGKTVFNDPSPTDYAPSKNLMTPLINRLWETIK